MAKMKTFPTLLAIVGLQAWHLSQLDVKNDFLYGDWHDYEHANIFDHVQMLSNLRIRVVVPTKIGNNVYS